MWASLKADVTEFVTTVKAETADKLNVLDAVGSLDEVGGEDDDGGRNGGDDDHGDDDASGGAMIDLGTGNMIVGSGPGGGDKGPAAPSSSAPSAPAMPSKEEMARYLRSCEAVFQDPLSEDEEAAMADFNLDDKTQEISQLLEGNPETLRATFAQLTSEVEYADFWKRYYCRLGGDDGDGGKKIEETFLTYREEEPEPGVPSALSSVTNFFGVAVSRLVDEEDGREEALAPSPFFNRTGDASAKSALGFLTGGGRPPFVLNTALSDEDEQKQQQEESEDEEELGWGEDSDDDDGDGDDQDDDCSEVVMEFKDTEKEALKEKLEQAMEERNRSQKTIEMQAAEIEELKAKITNDGDGGEEQAGASSASAPAPNEAFEKDLEDLKVQLFEREAEIAGLKLKMEDNKLENKNQEEEVAEQVRAHLEAKDETIASLQAQLDALKQNAENSDDALLKRSQSENRRLQAAVEQLQQQQESKDAESALALEESQAENRRLDGRAKSLSEEAAAGAARLDDVAREKEALALQLEDAKARQAGLERELEATKALLQQTQAEVETKTHSSGDGSQSTGIKVDSGEPAVEAASSNNVIDGDDWGDDW